MIRQYWWKILSFILLVYTCTMGFLVKVPKLDGRMQQTVRNLFFHVPMWFCMQTLFIVSVIYAIKYLRTPNPRFDYYSLEFARTGVVFGILGLITGAIWANYQWGQPWSGDPKQNGAAIAILIYMAYFVLRGSMTDMDKRSRISAVYNIFAFAMLFPTIWILPRLTESLHPGGQGSEGNPGLNPNDTTPEMEMVFLPAIIGWILLGVWISTLRTRLAILTEKKLSHE
ncbi:ABC transporter permease [Panacibacter ginsenosidivorans]|uniref:Heme exporter protein C n=1 Tax=Panacibacter ginsenosidivorans TaxID=1813871 RepID=A0A5B8V6W4_9BACT|nr:cytochrome c biogenesis protein CcsA [Panacibacter ginsenosidivorans]QEC66396.1 ABC transporter permease [Panacibacter ginsenosidivorans]